MPRKHYSAPELLLQRVVDTLEREEPEKLDREDPAQRAIMHALLREGPLTVADTVHQALDQTDWTELLTPRAELLQFTRGLVRGAGSRLSQSIGTFRGLTFTGHQVSGRVTVAVSGELRDVLVQQYVLLVLRVGLRAIRRCAAPDCQRCFVKTYRRTFHSTRCQKRVHARLWREQERKRKARWAAQQARRKTRSVKGVA